MQEYISKQAIESCKIGFNISIKWLYKILYTAGIYLKASNRQRDIIWVQQVFELKIIINVTYARKCLMIKKNNKCLQEIKVEYSVSL